MKDLIIFVATGFEDTELVASLDVFNRNDITYDLVSVEGLHEVKGKVEAYVKTKTQNDVSLNDYRGFFLPGGPGHKILLESKLVHEIIAAYSKNKIVSAICAAPEVLLRNNALNDVKYTSFPGFALSERNTGEEVVVDENVVTGRDFKATIKFAEALCEALKK